MAPPFANVAGRKLAVVLPSVNAVAASAAERTDLPVAANSDMHFLEQRSASDHTVALGKRGRHHSAGQQFATAVAGRMHTLLLLLLGAAVHMHPDQAARSATSSARRSGHFVAMAARTHLHPRPSGRPPSAAVPASDTPPAPRTDPASSPSPHSPSSATLAGPPASASPALDPAASARASYPAARRDLNTLYSGAGSESASRSNPWHHYSPTSPRPAASVASAGAAGLSGVLSSPLRALCCSSSG